MESSGLLQAHGPAPGCGRLTVDARRVCRVRLVCGGVVVVVLILVLGWRQARVEWWWGRQVTGGSGETAALTPSWRAASEPSGGEVSLLVVVRVGVRRSPT